MPSKYKSENTFAFFNLLFLSVVEIEEAFNDMDLSNPVAILTANSSPKVYKWKLIGEKPITIRFDYTSEISSLGFFKNRSTDPSLFLEPYFGLFPWDGYAEDNWIEKMYLLPNSEIRNDVKYLRDFSLYELSLLLPANSPKLKEIKKN